MTVEVDTAAGVLRHRDWSTICTIGRSGACDEPDKREGDGFTPRGTWPVRCALIRPDRGFPVPTLLPWRWLRPGDGWSDAIGDPDYNRPVRHPHRHSAEHLWRDDAVYDAIIVLGHNDTPPVVPCGSAIFLHVAGPRPTEGCVAVAPSDMARLLDRLAPGEAVHIV